MLGYAFLRERIIYHNSLASFEDSGNGPNVDINSIDTSIYNEQSLNKLKTGYRSILTDLVTLTGILDSELLCDQIIGNTVTGPTTTVDYTPSQNSTLEKPYETII